MLKLPKCPYCGSKLRYKASAGSMKQKESVCRKCGKRAQVKYRAKCVRIFALWCVSLIVLNTLILFHGNNRTLLPNLVVTVAAILVYIIITPLCVDLSEIDGERDPEPKRKKNRRRHKKTKFSDVRFDDNPLKGTSFDK